MSMEHPNVLSRYSKLRHAIFIDMLCYQKVRAGCECCMNKCIICHRYVNVSCYLERKLGSNKLRQ